MCIHEEEKEAKDGRGGRYERIFSESARCLLSGDPEEEERRAKPDVLVE